MAFGDVATTRHDLAASVRHDDGHQREGHEQIRHSRSRRPSGVHQRDAGLELAEPAVLSSGRRLRRSLGLTGCTRLLHPHHHCDPTCPRSRSGGWNATDWDLKLPLLTQALAACDWTLTASEVEGSKDSSRSPRLVEDAVAAALIPAGAPDGSSSTKRVGTMARRPQTKGDHTNLNASAKERAPFRGIHCPLQPDRVRSKIAVRVVTPAFPVSRVNGRRSRILIETPSRPRRTFSRGACSCPQRLL